MSVDCPSCHNHRDANAFIQPGALPPHITERIHQHKPHWSPDQPVCEICVNEAIAAESEDMLMLERGALTDLDIDVLDNLRSGDMIAQNVAEMDDMPHLTPQERLADRVTNTVGSFRFSASVMLLVVLWVTYGVVSGMAADHPAVLFGSLSGALGTLAAIQNPVILMAQRRQARRDRLQAENDYRVNLKSELEVRYLHQKIDFLLERMAAMEKHDP